jgi:hypothetical protein
MKPHIWFDQDIWCGWWCCGHEDLFVMGFGKTPKEAYLHWTLQPKERYEQRTSMALPCLEERRHGEAQVP